MILYHGSDQIIESPEIRISSRTLDFGQGFYTTTNKEQAVSFASKVYDRSIREGKTPKGRYISIYETNYEKMKQDLDVLYFETADESWLDFVMDNRRSTYEGKKYDIIYGPVANDTIYRTLIIYETGELSKSDIIARLKVRQLYDQITFTTPLSLSFLIYTGYMEVSNV